MPKLVGRSTVDWIVYETHRLLTWIHNHLLDLDGNDRVWTRHICFKSYKVYSLFPKLN